MIPRHKQKIHDKSKTLCNILIEWYPSTLLTKDDSEVTCSDCKEKLK